MTLRALEDSVGRIARLVTPVGVIGLLVLNSQYVTRAEYAAAADRFSGRLEKVEQVLIRMEANAETDKRHDAELADHEARLRTLEQGRRVN